MDMTFSPVVSKQIVVTTLLASIILVAGALLFFYLAHQVRGRGPIYYVLLANAVLMVLFLIGSTGFRIRSYELTSDNLAIHFGLGNKVYPLTGLQEARIVETPFAQARRVMGIGGLWCFYGQFRSADFGTFSAYAADQSRGVLLSWPDKKILVAPNNAEQFLQKVRPQK